MIKPSSSRAKPERGSITKQQVVFAFNPHMPSKIPDSTKLIISTQEPQTTILCIESDLLGKLPPEVLILVLQELPVKVYLDVVQACGHLRQFVRTHASGLCNYAILKKFPLEAERIPSTNINGWLVPEHKDILVLERYVLDKKKYVDRARGIILDQESQTRDLQVKLSQPGPQYLLWLESGKAIATNPALDENGKVKNINTLHLVALLKSLNAELMVLGRDDGKSPRDLTQRELIWYFGVPEDENSLPLLV